MSGLRYALAALALCAAAPGHAAGRSAEAIFGQKLAQARCAGCHDVENRGKSSPNRSAPPFQIIAMTYDPADLEEALVEGVTVAHNVKGDPAMPEFELTARDAGALVAYFRSLRGR